MCPSGYYQSVIGPVVTCAIGHMMHTHTFLAPVNQSMLNKSSKKHSKTGWKWLYKQGILMLYLIKHKALQKTYSFKF